MGRGIGSLDSRGGLTRTVLDASGATQQIVDPAGNLWQYLYDSAGRERTRFDPLNARTTTSYDADNRVTSVVDRLSRSIEYSYDDEDRRTKEVWKDNAGVTLNIITYTFDDNSNVTKIQDNAGTITYTYDAQDRVESYRNVFGQALTYTYDNDGRVTQRQDGFGGYLTSVYDTDGQLTSRKYKNGSDQYREDRLYSGRGEVTTLTRYSDVSGSTVAGTTVYARDDAMRLTSIQNKDGSNNVLSAYTYAYDSADRVTTHTYSSAVGTYTYSGTKTYTYDTTSQLTGDTGTPYSYDLNGNRGMSGYATGAGNQMTNDGTFTYTYDAQGNVSTKSKGAGLEKWFYTWDHRDRVVNIRKTSDGSTNTLSVTYTYDAQNTRVQEDKWKTGVGTVTTRLAHDGDQIWAYLDGSNVLQTLAVHGEGTDEVLARIVPSGGNAGVYAALTDNQGGVRDEHKFGAGLVNHVDYTAFGVATEHDPSAGGSVLYAGGDADRDTGLTTFGIRDYAAPTGRWQSPDPIYFGGGTPNLYEYVGNSPTNATDPSGLYELKRLTHASGLETLWAKNGTDLSHIGVFDPKTGLVTRLAADNRQVKLAKVELEVKAGTTWSGDEWDHWFRMNAESRAPLPPGSKKSDSERVRIGESNVYIFVKPKDYVKGGISDAKKLSNDLADKWFEEAKNRSSRLPWTVSSVAGSRTEIIKRIQTAVGDSATKGEPAIQQIEAGINEFRKAGSEAWKYNRLGR